MITDHDREPCYRRKSNRWLDVRYEVAAVHDAHINRRDARTFVDYLFQYTETFVSVTTVSGSERIDIKERFRVDIKT